MTRRDWWAGIATLIVVGSLACWFLPRHIAAVAAAGAIDGATERIQQIESGEHEYKSMAESDKIMSDLEAELKAGPATPEEGQKAIAQAIVNEYASGFERYKKDVKKYPPNLGELMKSTAAGWNGPYLGNTNNMAVDPWGHPYSCDVPGKHSNFYIWSFGPDGIDGNADDISNLDIVD